MTRHPLVLGTFAIGGLAPVLGLAQQAALAELQALSAIERVVEFQTSDAEGEKACRLTLKDGMEREDCVPVSGAEGPLENPHAVVAISRPGQATLNAVVVLKGSYSGAHEVLDALVVRPSPPSRITYASPGRVSIFARAFGADLGHLEGAANVRTAPGGEISWERQGARYRARLTPDARALEALEERVMRPRTHQGALHSLSWQRMPSGDYQYAVEAKPPVGRFSTLYHVVSDNVGPVDPKVFEHDESEGSAVIDGDKLWVIYKGKRVTTEGGNPAKRPQEPNPLPRYALFGVGGLFVVLLSALLVRLRAQGKR